MMRKTTVVIILALFAGGVLAAGFTLRALTLRADDTIIILCVVKPGDTFLLKYLHSVARSDVWERFVIDSEYRIVLTETRFQGQGAGLPTGLAGTERLTREGDWFAITGMSRRVPLIYWRVEQQWQNRLQFGSEPEKNVSQTIGNALVLVQVEAIGLFRWLAYRALAEIDNLKRRVSRR